MEQKKSVALELHGSVEKEMVGRCGRGIESWEFKSRRGRIFMMDDLSIKILSHKKILFEGEKETQDCSVSNVSDFKMASMKFGIPI